MSGLVVALRALKLGDFLTGLPALRALSRHFSDAEVVLAAPTRFRPLLELSGAASRLLETAELAPLDRASLGLRAGGPDVAVDLHGRGPLSQPLLTALSPRRLIAFAHPEVPATEGMPEWKPDEHEVTRWCRLLAESGIAADERRLGLAPPPRTAPRLAVGATVVHPGASSPARRWPAERFAAVARAEREAGRPVVITGSETEAPLCRAVAAGAGLAPESVLAGTTDLLSLAAVVSVSERLVSGDTGVAHLATAYGRPSVVLFGPVSPSLWGPPPSATQHISLWAGRSGDPHGKEVDPSLAEITVGDVLAALDRLPPASSVHAPPC